MYVLRPEGCLCALPLFVCIRPEISFSKGVKGRKSSTVPQSTCTGCRNSPCLMQQKIILSWDGLMARLVPPVVSEEAGNNLRGLKLFRNCRESMESLLHGKI